MELKQIKELMAAMERTCMKRVAIKREGFELELERESSGSCTAIDDRIDFSAEARSDLALRRAHATSRGLPSEIPTSPQVATEKSEALGSFVSSPMVGTFYSSPSPDDPSFVKVGDKIDKDSVVCIIEAMKVMNEVKAGISGTVAEILVESGHPVEFGTKLFRITP